MDIRKSALDLTVAERDDFLQALFLLKGRPARPGAQFSVYDQFAALHPAVMAIQVPGETNSVNVAHGNIGFLGWHREYLRRFELALQNEVPGVTIPYWDWTEHNRNLAEFFIDDYMGQVPPPPFSMLRGG